MRKIVFIGAGSLTFTRNLVRDLLTFPALADSTIALVDLDADRLAFAHAAVDHIIRAGRYPARVEAYTERSAALPGADGVVSTILVGGLEGGQGCAHRRSRAAILSRRRPRGGGSGRARRGRRRSPALEQGHDEEKDPVLHLCLRRSSTTPLGSVSAS